MTPKSDTCEGNDHTIVPPIVLSATLIPNRPIKTIAELLARVVDSEESTRDVKVIKLRICSNAHLL